MVIKRLTDTALLGNVKDVMRVHLYFKLLQNGIRPFETDMDIILELYFFGGYDNVEEQAEFINICLNKKYRRSYQSVRNTISKYIGIGVFDKPKNTILHVNEKFIPKIVDCDKLVLQHTISHAE